jgi:hypothetical protein
MRRLWPILLVVTACRDGNPAKPAEQGSASAPKHVAGTHQQPANPELPGAITPVAPSDGRLPTAAETFAAEPEDRDWKRATEPAVRKRVPRAAEIECHQSTCRITFTGKMDMLSAELDQLESDASLKGIAQSVLLTAPEPREDGNFSIRAYARFERPSSEP